jgi:hypothetical protein
MVLFLMADFLCYAEYRSRPDFTKARIAVDSSENCLVKVRDQAQ